MKQAEAVFLDALTAINVFLEGILDLSLQKGLLMKLNICLGVVLKRYIL